MPRLERGLTSLYRCRTALSELREHFNALTPARASWSAEVWPERSGLVVYRKSGNRIAEPMRWGIPRTILNGVRNGRPVSTTMWFQRRNPTQSARFENPWRCLIVLDSFACPSGSPGARTRTWFGLDDRPIFAWAGVWAQVEDGKVFCGMLAPSNNVVFRPSMPVILDPDDYDLWLGGRLDRAAPLANRPYGEGRMYREELGEPWGGDTR
ncbi:SOS response-associated peptidase family protein [Altericroceibacterium spongiae]|uniref:SOS response-associated peptidase family protein n=1 Tax=Altericroceibacterium spongiae TaxID=2320269 RepID=UPI0011C41E6D|nr:SOS response-associated peptidase family protein [Altericroceibacterium spongiae]